MKKCYSHIKPFERKTIRELLDMGCSKAKIAYVLDRPRSTVSREMERNGYIDMAGKLVYDPEHAQLQSRNRKAKAGYGKGRRRKGFPVWKSYCEFTNPVEYRPQYGRWRQYWAHEFKNRKKDLRAYCAFNYYWNSIMGRIWRKKYKQKRYKYSQPPIFAPKRPDRRRPIYHWLYDHKPFRTWKKRTRRLKTYSLLELDVMKMCRKKRIRKNRQLPRAPLFYQWPKRFWEIESEALVPENKHGETSKLLDKGTHRLCKIDVLTSKYRRGASGPEEKGRIFKIYTSFGRGQVHALQKMTA